MTIEVSLEELPPIEVTVADIAVEVVTSGPAGPPGPPGEPGPPGGEGLVPTDVGYRHVQASAATIWNITHALPFWPSVVVVDSTKRQVIPGEVLYLSATSIQLTFSAALGGEAYLT
jgi:hypothetical protein